MARFSASVPLKAKITRRASVAPIKRATAWRVVVHRATDRHRLVVRAAARRGADLALIAIDGL